MAGESCEAIPLHRKEGKQVINPFQNKIPSLLLERLLSISPSRDSKLSSWNRRRYWAETLREKRYICLKMLKLHNTYYTIQQGAQDMVWSRAASSWT